MAENKYGFHSLGGWKAISFFEISCGLYSVVISWVINLMLRWSESALNLKYVFLLVQYYCQ